MGAPFIDNTNALLSRENTFTQPQEFKNTISAYFNSDTASQIFGIAVSTTQFNLNWYNSSTKAYTGNFLNLRAGSGLRMGGASGTYPAQGKISAVGFCKNGTDIPYQESFESAAQTITAGGLLTIAHGLSSTPKVSDIQAYLKCTTASSG